MERREHVRTTWIAFGLIGFGLFLTLGFGNILLALIFASTLLLPAGGLWYAYQSGHPATAALAVPSMIIGGTGAILVFQSLTGYWESWAYAWTLYGVFLGYGLILMGRRLEESALIQIGRVMVLIGGVSFAGLGSLYILLTTPILRYLVAFAAFVAAGYILWGKTDGQLITFPPKQKIKHSNPIVEEKAQRIHINLEEDAA